MQPDDTLISGWNATDDETPVPVRSSEPAAQGSVQIQSGPAADIGHEDRGHVLIEHHEQAAANPRAMTLSAVIGVLIAIGGVGAYLGIGGINLRGDVTGVSNEPVTITITDAGQFDPPTVDVHPGQSVTITNKNTDPQVLKPKNGRDLFPVQVVFDQPYTFTIPESAAGQYVYYSETLPDDRTVTFNVTVVQAVSSSSAASVTDTPAQNPPPDSLSIPLPFGGGSVDIPQPEQNTPAPAPVTNVNVESTPHSGDTATIDLGISSSETASSVSNTGIPTNPYTVANAPKVIPTSIASSASSERLHSGAPLLVDTIRKPSRTPDSGTGGVMLLFIPALLGVVMLSRKMAML